MSCRGCSASLLTSCFTISLLQLKIVGLGSINELPRLLNDPFPALKEAAAALTASLSSGDNSIKGQIVASGIVPVLVKSMQARAAVIMCQCWMV